MNTTKAIAIGVIILIALFVGGWALKAGMLPFLTVTSQIDSAGDVIDKTYSADNAVYYVPIGEAGLPLFKEVEGRNNRAASAAAAAADAS